MGRLFKHMLNRYRIWCVFLLILNVVFTFFLWLVVKESFITLFIIILMGITLLFMLFSLIVYESDQKKHYALINYLYSQTNYNRQIYTELLDHKEKVAFEVLSETLKTLRHSVGERTTKLDEYESYIKKWSHEIKTPLALINMVLENRSDEMSESVFTKVDYSKTRIQEEIDRILYYSRIKAEHVDYNFKNENIKMICEDVLYEYNSLAQENGVILKNSIEHDYAVTDRNGISFILKQIISNAIKYCDKEKSDSFVEISSNICDERYVLSIKDNGIGVKCYDVPFIFDNGFVGSGTTVFNNSTGMGLYLSNEVAGRIKATLDINESYLDGFEIKIII